MMKYTAEIKKLSFVVLLFVCMAWSGKVQAQPFYGYQSITKNTFMFSLIWQGEPKIGFGYIYRITGGKTFTDMEFELRFPLKTIYRFEEYEAIAGMYKPLKYSRAFAGVGGHFRWNSKLDGGQRVQKLSLAATVIPSYVYSANTNPGGIYGTTGIRITYAPVIFATAKSGESKADWDFFPQHKFEGGIHLDMIIDLSAGIALNGITSYYLNSKNTFLQEEKNWQVEGDLYFGATYSLDRN